MKNFISIRSLFLIAFIWIFEVSAQTPEGRHQEFIRSKEKSLHVILEVSFGNISIEYGEKDRIATIDYDEETNRQKLEISYDISNYIGTLHIKSKESAFHWNNDEDHKGRNNNLDIKLTNAVPISFEIELGAGKGKIDLTDLQVKDMKISTGASKVIMKCGKINPIDADKISIESGVSKFVATDLGNLNFHDLKFNGGIGSYELDFNGKFRNNAEVQIEIGIGSIKIDLPKAVPAKLIYSDHWFSSFDIDEDFNKQTTDVYETEDFSSAQKHITVQLQAGLGSVKVRRK